MLTSFSPVLNIACGIVDASVASEGPLDGGGEGALEIDTSNQ